MSNFLSLKVRRVSKRRIELPQFEIDYWPWIGPEPKCCSLISYSRSSFLSHLQASDLSSPPGDLLPCSVWTKAHIHLYCPSAPRQPSSKDFISLLHCLHLWCPSLPTEYNLCCLNIPLLSGSLPRFPIATVMTLSLETL